MSHLLVLLIVLVTTFLSGLLSPASGQRFRFPPFLGTNASPLEPVPSGGALEVPTGSQAIFLNCIQEGAPEAGCGIGNETMLNSTNPDVATVSLDPEDCVEVNGATPCIIIGNPGSTTVELLDSNNEALAAFVLVVTPSPPQFVRPGTRCEVSEGIVDCSGTCVSLSEAQQRLGDGVCDNGQPLPDGSRDIDLSCVFIPEFFRDDDGLIRAFTNRTNRDGGDCDREQSCEAQFGAAPGYEFCSGTASLCSFNASTGEPPTGNDTTRMGTCAAMCQQFGSRCVAALDNEAPGCTPSPNNAGTCETLRQTEICVCERR
jgi:hypothetical protein